MTSSLGANLVYERNEFGGHIKRTRTPNIVQLQNYNERLLFEEFSIEADSFEELLDSFVLTLTAKKESIRLLEFI